MDGINLGPKAAGRADACVAGGDSAGSGGPALALMKILEEAVEASAALRPELPAWLCGRLASLYRTQGFYDDEVHLLERFRESQRSEAAKARYDARLSKARTIAERRRRRDSGALESVRASMGIPPTRRVARIVSGERASPVFSPGTTSELSGAFAARSRDDTQLDQALALLCAEAHANEIPVEELVAELKRASRTPGARRTSARHARHDRALLVLLRLYFKEPQT